MTPETRGLQALDRAQELTCMVRDESPTDTGAWLQRLGRADLEALAVILAAMVPDDRSADDLLAWVPEPVTPIENAPSRRPIAGIPDDVKKAHAAYERARSANVDPAEWVVEGERRYQSLRYRLRLRKQRADRRLA